MENDLVLATFDDNGLVSIHDKQLDATLEFSGDYWSFVIEHHLDVIKNADYIVDLGPGAGDQGGYIVATGTPEEVTTEKSSATGQYLSRVLHRDIEHVLTS